MKRLLRFFVSQSRDEHEGKKNNTDVFSKLLQHELIWHDEEVFKEAERIRKLDCIEFNNQKLAVHKNFRVFIVQSSIEFAFSQELLSKLVFVQTDLDDEKSWKQTFFDHLVNSVDFEFKTREVTI